jgi:hypothetical protein
MIADLKLPAERDSNTDNNARVTGNMRAFEENRRKPGSRSQLSNAIHVYSRASAKTHPRDGTESTRKHPINYFSFP